MNDDEIREIIHWLQDRGFPVIAYIDTEHALHLTIEIAHEADGPKTRP